MTMTRRIPGKSTVRIERATLQVTEGPDRGRAVTLEEGVLVIGTHEEAGLRLNDPTVSRRHSEISRTSEGFLLQDLGSTNGTQLDGVRVDRAYLKAGSIITLGKSVLGFQLSSETIDPKAGKLTRFGDMVGQSGPMREAFSLLSKLAVHDVTVLIDGETGTGKELAARALHDHGSRARGPFVVFDCSTVPSELMESELFGHRKGAFTGATEDRAGAVEQAEGGTLFLDEIGELPPTLQPKLLRLLDRREFRRLGTDGVRHTDIRFVAATNRDLEKQVRDGTFRQDLYFRVSAARVKLPPLRERPEDIPALAAHLLVEISGRSGKKARLERDAERALKAYNWPGNVRELKNVLETSVALTTGDTITVDDLPPLGGGGGEAGGGSIRDAEAQAIREALDRAGGNKRKAARLLGIAPSTLYAKMKQYRI
ncbi:MAG: sigma 54-dependent Fis family transcriptional regulator [bacterium]|nr:MAG: sigma 54-dependent Fis family transcriptional regulator [bacterium]